MVRRGFVSSSNKHKTTSQPLSWAAWQLGEPCAHQLPTCTAVLPALGTTSGMDQPSQNTVRWKPGPEVLRHRSGGGVGGVTGRGHGLDGVQVSPGGRLWDPTLGIEGQVLVSWVNCAITSHRPPEQGACGSCTRWAHSDGQTPCTCCFLGNPLDVV